MVEFTSYLLGIAGATARSVQRWRLCAAVAFMCSGGVYVHVMCIPRENECVYM